MKKLAVLFVVFMALYQTACGGDKGGGTDTGDKDVNIGTDEGQDAQKEVTTDTVVDDVKTDVKYDIPTDLPTDTPKDEGGKDEGTTETIGDDVKDVPPQDVPTSEEVTQMGLSCKEFWVCVGECPQGTQGEACVADCQAQMTSDAAMQVQALGGCLQNNGCYDKPTDDEFYACLEEFCLDEYFMCFSGNTYQTCVDLNNCLNACPEDNPETPDVQEDQECWGNCFSEATYQANIDFENMRKCLIAQCPDEQWTNECINAAIEGPCKTQAEKCLPQGTLKCGEILTCMGNCPQGDQKCAQDCVSSGTFEAQNLLFAIYGCFDEACPPPKDTEECYMNAEQNQCKPQVDACANQT